MPRNPSVKLVIIEQAELTMRLIERATGIPRPAGTTLQQAQACVPPAMLVHFEDLARVAMNYLGEAYAATGVTVDYVTERPNAASH